MEAKEHIIKINLPGGYISAGDLYEILLIAENAGAAHIRFGNRQQLYFSIHADSLEDLEMEMLKAEIKYEVDADIYPNIISSYVADTIFNHEGWLREGVYKDILDSFDHQPRLKVNLVDSQQTFVPFFSGNINFIVSDVNNYWYVYIRFPKTGRQYCYPSLVYSEDIPAFTKIIEDTILQNRYLFYDQANIDDGLFHKMVQAKPGITLLGVTQPLKLPDFYLPYYEGFNKHNNKYWLGIYRRSELFSIAFLKEACSLCLKTRIGQLYTTPWKSIIIKGIEQADRMLWGHILSRFRLNIRHAANELNWQIEDICDEGLQLKQQLVREMEEADLRTYQLCFAIKTQPKSGLPGSVIIKKTKNGLYDLLHSKDFNPNSKEYISYAKNLQPGLLSENIIALCDVFYDLQSDAAVSDKPAAIRETNPNNELIEVYQCDHCLTRYDKAFGDTTNGIEKDTEFEDITDYCCPVCDAPKSEFSLVTSL